MLQARHDVMVHKVVLDFDESAFMHYLIYDQNRFAHTLQFTYCFIVVGANVSRPEIAASAIRS